MSDIFQYYDLMFYIVDYCVISSWTKIARVCKFWHSIIIKKRDKLYFKFLNDQPQENRLVKIVNDEYYLPAYNHFHSKFTINRMGKKGKYIISHFMFASFECQVEVNICELNLLYNLIPTTKNFYNEKIVEFINLINIEHIEKYVNIKTLLEEKLEIYLIMESNNKYYSFHYDKKLYYFEKEADAKHYGLFNLVISRLLNF